MRHGEPQRSPHQRPDFGEAQPWERVEEKIAAHWPELSLFVHEIRKRNIDHAMYAAVGIGGPLYLAMSRTWPFDGDVLRVGLDKGAIRLTYLASGRAAKGFYDYNWDHAYPPDQVWAAFARFLVRAHWFPSAHPALQEAPYG